MERLVPYVRNCPRCNDSKLPDGGTLVVGYHSKYVPPQFPPGYTGQFPVVRKLIGISEGRVHNSHFLIERKESFNSASFRPRLRLPYRKPTAYTPENVPYRLTHFDPATKEHLDYLYMAVQNHRDKYRDLTGTRLADPYYGYHHEHDKNKFLRPIMSYYMHYNRRPGPGKPDDDWSYGPLTNEVYYHGCRDQLGRLSQCYKHLMHPRTPDKIIESAMFGRR